MGSSDPFRHGLPGGVSVALRVGIILVALTVGFARAAPALTIFDIIQLTESGYDDGQIVALIEATNSVFDLEAADLVRLKDLGIGETVIRSMVMRMPPRPLEPSEERPASAEPLSQASGARLIAGQRPQSLASVARSGTVGSPAAPRAERAAPGLREPTLGAPSGPIRRGVAFTTVTVQEEDAGDHTHVAVAFSGLQLLILREEGRYPSIGARATAVAGQLRAAWAAGDGEFRRGLVEGTEAVIFHSALDGQDIVVVAATAGDAYAYEIRSGRHVTPELLARYWTDLLSDYWAVIARGSPPTRLLGIHEGEALGVFYHALHSAPGPGDQTIDAAADLLPSSVRHHLARLAATVPGEYRRDEE